MELELIREGSITKMGTPGYLQYDNQKFPSIEREWLDNKAFLSCIPLGRYHLEPYSSTKYPNHYALVNVGLSVYAKQEDIPEGTEGRYAILIHVANTADQLAGCIAIGLDRAYIKPNGHSIGLGVSASKKAFKSLMIALDNDEEKHITISARKETW